MSSLNKSNPPDYWRSLGELEQSPEFQEFLTREFPQQALQSPVSRRSFVQLMGASLAFAGLDACRWQEDKIVPLSRRPEGYVPGVPRSYSTAIERGGVATGLRVTAYDGRPIKIEGNPEHPFTSGGTSAFDQASVLEMYDPDRSRRVLHDGHGATLQDFARFAGGLAGARLHVLSEATSSPTVQRLRRAMTAKFPELRWLEYEPLSRDNEREGMRLAFGEPVRPLARLDRAKIILALDGDFLVDHPASLRYARDFAKGRRPEDGPMNRLYAVESTFSNSGASADHRLPLRSELVLPFVMALEAKIRGSEAPSATFLADEKIAKFLGALAEDLKDGGAGSVILAGPRQPPEVHAICARIHEALGSVGGALEYVADPEPERLSHPAAITALAQDVRRGLVDAVLILGGNPVFDAPADLDLYGLLREVETTIHVGLYQDETAARCTWHVPRAHFLESWGDARSYDGTLSLVQPLIEPLHGGQTVIEVLAMLAGQAASAEAQVKETLAALHPDVDFRTALHDGFVPGSAYATTSPTPRPMAAPHLTDRQKGGLAVPGGKVEVVFTTSSHTYDGRFANNGWLQETPDPLTRLTWDNAALVSPKTAEDLGLAHQALVQLRVGERLVIVPVYVMPGQAPGSIALAVGHGRTRAGHVGGLTDQGIASPGHDAYPLRVSRAMWIVPGVAVKDTGETTLLACVQDHWAMDRLGREGIQERLGEIVRTTTAEEYASPHFGFEHEGPPLESLFQRHAVLGPDTKGHRWGMATDLSTCIGCNACAVACQAENNVPIVGKEQVARTREMAWIRIDRYFGGDPEDPALVHQPVTCQHCEMAPCEEVCPVGATVHSDEGINEMVYNRCVGTRYCLNNCPYKVRRFNYLDWHGDDGVPLENFAAPRNGVRKLMLNPEATVRSRGVMEKCSFCVQRIEGAKIRAITEERALVDGEVKTACMQACPTEAIVFGDLTDRTSRVSKLHDKERYRRGYALLAELNTAPRNTYLAKVRNPNPSLTG